MGFSIISIESDGVVRVAATGDLTSTSFEVGQAHPFEQLMGAQWSGNRIVVSFEKAEYMDSSAIGWLIACQKQIASQGGQLILHSVPPSVQQIFKLIRIDRILALAEDEAAALSKARGDV